jgi:hypothetical protein
MKNFALAAVCLCFPCEFLLAQLQRVSGFSLKYPVEQLYYYPDCGINPGILLRITDKDSISFPRGMGITNVNSAVIFRNGKGEPGFRHLFVLDKKELALSENEWVSFITATSVYTVHYVSETECDLKKYHRKKGTYSEESAKRIYLKEEWMQPLVLNGIPLGWSKVPLHPEELKEASIEITGTDFKTQFTVARNCRAYDLQAIGRDSLLFTFLSNKETVTSEVYSLTGKRLGSATYESESPVRKLQQVLYSGATQSVDLVLDVSKGFRAATTVVKLKLNSADRPAISYNDLIDAAGLFNRSLLVHPAGMFNAPGKNIFFIGHDFFRVNDSLNIESELRDRMSMEKLSKMNFAWKTGGFYNDPEGNWTAIHVFEYGHSTMEISVNYLLVYFKDGHTQVEKLPPGYGISILPVSPGRIVVGFAKEVVVYEVF